MDRDKLPLRLKMFSEASLASKRKYGTFAQLCSSYMLGHVVT